MQAGTDAFLVLFIIGLDDVEFLDTSLIQLVGQETGGIGTPEDIGYFRESFDAVGDPAAEFGFLGIGEVLLTIPGKPGLFTAQTVSQPQIVIPDKEFLCFVRGNGYSVLGMKAQIAQFILFRIVFIIVIFEYKTNQAVSDRAGTEGDIRDTEAFRQRLMIEQGCFIAVLIDQCEGDGDVITVPCFPGIPEMCIIVGIRSDITVQNSVLDVPRCQFLGCFVSFAHVGHSVIPPLLQILYRTQAGDERSDLVVE